MGRGEKLLRVGGILAKLTGFILKAGHGDQISYKEWGRIRNLIRV